MDEIEPLDVSPEKKQWLLAQLAGVYEEAVHEHDIPPASAAVGIETFAVRVQHEIFTETFGRDDQD